MGLCWGTYWDTSKRIRWTLSRARLYVVGLALLGPRLVFKTSKQENIWFYNIGQSRTGRHTRRTPLGKLFRLQHTRDFSAYGAYSNRVKREQWIEYIKDYLEKLKIARDLRHPSYYFFFPTDKDVGPTATCGQVYVYWTYWSFCIGLKPNSCRRESSTVATVYHLRYLETRILLILKKTRKVSRCRLFGHKHFDSNLIFKGSTRGEAGGGSGVGGRLLVGEGEGRAYRDIALIINV